MRGFISGLSILFHWSIFLSLCQYHTVFMTSFVVEPEVRQVDFSSSIFLSQDCFGYLGFFVFPTPFLKKFYWLIYGCTGSSLLCRLFSSCGKWGSSLLVVHRFLIAVASHCSRAWGVGCVGFSSWMLPSVYPATAVWSNHLVEWVIDYGLPWWLRQ